MEKEIAVIDTNSLIFIAKLNIFNLVKGMFKRILVPAKVYDAVFEKESQESPILKKEFESFLSKVEVKRMHNLPLGEGEKSAISYCLDNNIEIFISDDKKARAIADSLGLKVIGILGFILRGLEDKKIKKEECIRLIKTAREKGFYIYPELYEKTIHLIDSN